MAAALDPVTNATVRAGPEPAMIGSVADSAWTDAERAFVRSQHVGRLATVAPDGQPDVVTLRYQMHGEDVLVGGPGLDGTQAWQNLAVSAAAALLVEGRHASVPERGLLAHGTATREPDRPVPVVRLRVRRVRSWGLT